MIIRIWKAKKNNVIKYYRCCSGKYKNTLVKDKLLCDDFIEEIRQKTFNIMDGKIDGSK